LLLLWNCGLASYRRNMPPITPPMKVAPASPPSLRWVTGALLPLLAGGALLARRGTHWLSPLAVGTVANDKRPFSVIQFTLC